MTTVLIRELPPVPSPRIRPDVAPAPPPSAGGLRRLLLVHRSALIGYAVPVLATALAVAGWFRSGRFVASGDVAPFVRENLSREWWSLWSHQASGSGSTSYESGRGAEVLLLTMTHALHLSDVVAQWALFTACCGLAAFGSAFFAASWVRRPGVIAVVGGIGAFNAFQLVSLPNLLPAVAIGVAGIFGGLLLRSAQGRRVPAARFVLAALPLSYLSLNPPLLVVVLAWGLVVACAAGVLVGPGGVRQAFRSGLRAVPLVLLTSAWWLVPFVVASLDPVGVAFTAQTDVQAWAWSQARNSIPNVLTLNAHWGWNQVEYFPYAPSMDGVPVSWGRWLLPALAAAGVVRSGAARRRAALTLGASLLLLVFVAKGLHPPMAEVNDWLFRHVPGMWLLREPMSKVGPLLVLVEGVLAAFAIEAVLDHPPLGGRGRRAVVIALSVCTVGALAYPWPLWTGAVVSDGGAALPGAHVAVPDAWRTTADQVNRLGGPGAVLVLPLDPYYQVTTSWGYHGVDAVPQQLFQRPVLQLLPGGYFAPTAGVQALMSGAAAALLDGDAAGARRRLEALGVSTVVVRRDLVRGGSDLPFADPAALMRGAGSLADTQVISDTAVARAWRLEHSGSRVTASGSLLAAPPGTDDRVAAAVASLPENAALSVTASGTDGLSWQTDGGQDSASVPLAQPGSYRLATSAADGSYYRVHLEKRSPTRYDLTLTPTATLSLDGRPIATQPAITLPPLPAQPTVLVSDGVTHNLTDGMVVRLSGIAHLSALTDGGPGDPGGPPAGHGDCANTPTTPARGLSMIVLPDGRVRLASETHSACAWWTVGSARSAGPLLVSVTAQLVQGAPPRACLWRPAENRCLVPSQTARDANGTTWSFVDASPDTAADQLFVYADGAPGGSSIVFTPPTTRHLRVLAAADARTGADDVVLNGLTAGPHRLQYADDIPDEQLRPLSAVEDCNAATGTGSPELGALSIPGGVQLRASADSACAWTGPPETSVASRYRLAVSYRTVSGNPARVCVWEVGPDRCADVPAPERAGPGWRTLTTEVATDPGTSALRIYVYADGDGAGPTVTEYRNIELRPSAPVGLSLAPLTPLRPPEVSSSCTAASCDVSVRGARGSFILELADSFATGWQLSGLPPGWRAEHIQTDGYANGWRIAGSGDASLSLSYAPQRWVAAAQVTSGLAGAALAAWMLLARALPLWRRGRAPQRPPVKTPTVAGRTRWVRYGPFGYHRVRP